MAAISLKLPDEVAQASLHCANFLKLSLSEYIRQAVKEMNRKTRARLRARKLADASRRVWQESKRVNAEFSAIERNLRAAVPAKGLAGIAGGWKDSEELVRAVGRLRRTGPRRAPRLT